MEHLGSVYLKVEPECRGGFHQVCLTDRLTKAKTHYWMNHTLIQEYDKIQHDIYQKVPCIYHTQPGARVHMTTVNAELQPATPDDPTISITSSQCSTDNVSTPLASDGAGAKVVADNVVLSPVETGQVLEPSHDVLVNPAKLASHLKCDVQNVVKLRFSTSLTISKTRYLISYIFANGQEHHFTATLPLLKSELEKICPTTYRRLLAERAPPLFDRENPKQYPVPVSLDAQIKTKPSSHYPIILSPCESEDEESEDEETESEDDDAETEDESEDETESEESEGEETESEEDEDADIYEEVIDESLKREHQRIVDALKTVEQERANLCV